MNFFLGVLLVLLFTMSLNSCSYALTTEITDEISEQILNFGIQQETNPTNLSILKNINPSQFTAYFNSKVSLINGLEDLSQLFVIYSDKTFTFCTTNSTIGTSLNYAHLYMQTYNSYWCVNNTRRLSIKCSSGSNPFSYTYDNDMNTEALGIAYDDAFDYSFNNDLTIMTTNKMLALGNITVIKYDNTNYILKPSVSITSEEPGTPVEPSGDHSGTTGTITNPSGDTTGKVDLSGIESGIGNINQNLEQTNQKLDGISGEIGKLNDNLTAVPDVGGTLISSGDITSSLNFEFAEDPYSNFWLELTTGLSGALTNNVRSIDVQFRGETYKIELDKFALQTPQFLKSFLAILSTVFIFWKMIKYWKITIDNITSGNMDEVLEMNEEERHY